MRNSHYNCIYHFVTIPFPYFVWYCFLAEMNHSSVSNVCDHMKRWIIQCFFLFFYSPRTDELYHDVTHAFCLLFLSWYIRIYLEIKKNERTHSKLVINSEIVIYGQLLANTLENHPLRFKKNWNKSWYTKVCMWEQQRKEMTTIIIQIKFSATRKAAW